MDITHPGNSNFDVNFYWEHKFDIHIWNHKKVKGIKFSGSHILSKTIRQMFCHLELGL